MAGAIMTPSTQKTKLEAIWNGSLINPFANRWQDTLKVKCVEGTLPNEGSEHMFYPSQHEQRQLRTHPNPTQTNVC
jgi:hypothetical protein